YVLTEAFWDGIRFPWEGGKTTGVPLSSVPSECAMSVTPETVRSEEEASRGTKTEKGNPASSGAQDGQQVRSQVSEMFGFIKRRAFHINNNINNNNINNNNNNNNNNNGVTQNGSGSSSVTSPALVLVETPNESVCGGTVVSTKMNEEEMEDIYSDTEVYHPLAVVGKGTFGKVLQCWRARDGELVALKALPTAPHMRSLTMNELRLTAALARPDVDRSHIVRFFGSFRHHAEHYLVLEMLEKNLYQLQMENGFRPLPIRHIRTISCQLLRALAKLKEMAIIHADLKPENVMLVDQVRFPFRVKLIDFGSASFFKEVRFIKEPYIQSRFYRSPEILLGLPFSEKVDMWSLGCAMTELYLGWPLYPGDSEFEQVRYICETQGLPSPRLLNMATKANLFFEPTETAHGNPAWRLRPTGGQTGVDFVTPERRKYILRSLDQLYNVHGPEHDQVFGQADTAAELSDRHCMVEFIKRMLTIDSRRRIKPNAALRHPFLTLTHLQGSKTPYYDLSLQELQNALIPKRSPEPHSDNLSNPTPEPQTAPPAYGDQTGSFPPGLSYQEVASHQCSEGDHQPCCDGSDWRARGLEPKHHGPCCGTHTLTQTQAVTEQMKELHLAEVGSQRNAQAGWFGDAAAGPVQDAGLAHELQACPRFKEPEHSLANLPPSWPQTELAYMLTPQTPTSHSITQLHARPSRSDPAGHLHSSLQVHAGNSSFSGSAGISQEMFSHLPEEPSEPPQVFPAETQGLLLSSEREINPAVDLAHTLHGPGLARETHWPVRETFPPVL
ncbi:hypothetical protein NFI96_017794, partial [Prochilodus magdalenae]